MNRLELKAAMIRNGYSVVRLSNEIGINPATFYRKANNGTFTIQDVNKIKAILELSNKEVSAIFFAQ